MKKKLTARDLHQLESLSGRTIKQIKGAILSVDYGEKFCGIAWSPNGGVVFPIKVVARENAVADIKTLLVQKNIQTLVFGLPLGSRNEENHICQQIRVFAKNFTDVLVEFQNEQFSSQSVVNVAERIDDLAAAKILEYWLEKK